MSKRVLVAAAVALPILGAGCADVRRAEPGPRATSSVVEFRRADMPLRWVVTVNNPTQEPVYIDCEEARIPIAPGTQADVLLVPDDVECDLVNATEYVNDTGERAPARKRFHWAKRHRMRVSP